MLKTSRRILISLILIVAWGSVMPSAQQRLKTGLFVAPPTVVLGDVTLTVPDPAGAQLTIPASVTIIDSTLNLSNTDKLSVGLVFTFGVYVSTDNAQTWQFVNGFTWNSYGPAGLTVTDPDGTVRVNPDPRLHTNVSPYPSAKVRIVALASRTVTVGLTVQTF